MSPDLDSTHDVADPPAETIPADDVALIASQLDQDIDENLDPEAVIEAQHVDVATSLQAATFDTVVPAAVLAARGAIYQTMNFNGLFSLDPYSLADYFRQQLGEIDTDGKPVDKDDDGWDDYADRQQERAEERREQYQRDIEATFSEEQIDATAWVGDPDETWTFDGQSATRKQWLAGAKAVRKTIQQKVADGDMPEEEGARQLRYISEYELALKEHRYADAADAREHLPPETQAALDQQAHSGVVATQDVSAATAHKATSAASGMTTSTDARSDALSQMAVADASYELALKEGREADAALAKKHISSETQRLIDEEARKYTAKPQHGIVSTDIPADISSKPANDELRRDFRGDKSTGAADRSALTHPPDVILTEEFTAAATPQATAAPSAKPVELASTAPTPTPLKLDQTLSF